MLVVGGSSPPAAKPGPTTTWAIAPTLDLVGEQNELARAMFALGKPVVVVLINGRPLSVNRNRGARRMRSSKAGTSGRKAARRSPTSCSARQPGRQTAGDHRALGRPAADVLQPEAERAPRLPVRFDRAAVPVRLSGCRTRRSRSARRGCPPPKIGADERVKVYGRRAQHRQGRRRRSRAALRARRRQLGHAAGQGAQGIPARDAAPGATTTVEFTLGREAFALWDEKMKHVVEPGEFTIMAGPNSVDLKSAVLMVGQAGE